MHTTPLTHTAGAWALACITFGFTPASASIDASWSGPGLDRWMYPFNPTPGTRITASTFGATNEPDFDDRDGQMVVGWRTDDQVPTGAGAAQYQVHAARVIVEIAANETFVYDDSPDTWQNFVPEDDPDYQEDGTPGQPIELFGVGYRFGFTKFSWQETTPYTFGDPIGEERRTAYALGFDSGGMPVDVSNSVRDRWNPQAWAVGMITGIRPGDLVPSGSLVEFTLDVAHPGVQSYLREALDAGILNLAITSLTKVQQFGGLFPVYFCREHPDVAFGFATAARLELRVSIGSPCPADLDGSGGVDFADLLIVLGDSGPCAGCPSDLDGSGTVDFADVLSLLAAWGPCP
ncbi:MAG: hypothetical protein KF817_07470 [Phycisphaeraceae bacterium]|nr:hypothetical protein [Phycisphaeraceae bacterium]